MFKENVGKFIGQTVSEKSLPPKTDENDIKNLHDTIDRVDKYRQYAELGRDLHAQYEAFIAAGFTEAQAFRMILTMISNAVVGATK